MNELNFFCCSGFNGLIFRTDFLKNEIGGIEDILENRSCFVNKEPTQRIVLSIFPLKTTGGTSTDEIW
jgi:hypothetical protein